jgi:hypothetical protein
LGYTFFSGLDLLGGRIFLVGKQVHRSAKLPDPDKKYQLSKQLTKTI